MNPESTPTNNGTDHSQKARPNLRNATSRFAIALRVAEISEQVKDTLWEAYLDDVESRQTSLVANIRKRLDQNELASSAKNGKIDAIKKRSNHVPPGNECPGQERLVQAKAIPDRIRVLNELFKLHVESGRTYRDYTDVYRGYWFTLIRPVGTCIEHCYGGDEDAFIEMFVATGRKLKKRAPYLCPSCDHLNREKKARKGRMKRLAAQAAQNQTFLGTV